MRKCTTQLYKQACQDGTLRETLRTHNGLHIDGDLTFTQLEKLVAESKQYIAQTEKPDVINGAVGPAYEKISMYPVENVHSLPQISDVVSVLHRTLARGKERVVPYVSICTLSPLDGMTSHRDYSYNRYALATIPLEGRLLFGVGKKGASIHEREDAYNNLSLLQIGDIGLSYAPADDESNDVRPNFCSFAIDNVLALRVWFRNEKQ